MMDAKFNCASNAPSRDMAVFRVPYCDAELVDVKRNEEGEPATNTLSAEQSFMKSFLSDCLEVHAAYNLNFQRYKAQVDIHQLMPEKAVMNELRQLKSAHAQFLTWKADQEATVEEMKGQGLTEAQKESMSPEEQEAFTQQLQENTESIVSEIAEQTKADEQDADRIAELKELAKRSLDEDRPKGHFSDKTYQRDFIPNSEVSNGVAAVLSAMVSQISFENSQSQMTDQSVADESTQPETLDDLFENYQREIAYDCHLMDREPPEEEFSQDRLKGVLPTYVNVYDTVDTSTQPVVSLPAGMVEDHGEHARKIAEREKEAGRCIVLPGKDRTMMPPYAQKSKRLRDFENPQFYPFSTLPIEDAERTLQLKQLQKLIKQEKIDEGAAIKERLGKHKIFERKYDQYFTQDIMSQVLQEALRQDPDVTAGYYARTDSLLLILHNKINNQKRASDNLDKAHGLKTWTADVRVMPSFQNWIGHYEKTLVKDEEYKPKEPSDAPIKYAQEGPIPEVMIDVNESKVQNLESALS